MKMSKNKKPDPHVTKAESQNNKKQIANNNVVIQAVKKIRNEPFLFIISIATLLISGAFIVSNPSSTDLRFVVGVIAFLAILVVVGYFFFEAKKDKNPLNSINLQELHTNTNGLNSVEIIDESGVEFIRQYIGIIGIYSNLDECKDDMQKEFKESRHCKMLLQIGRKEFGDGESSFFWPIAKEKVTSGTSIQILRASERSPFLSERRAKLRNTTSVQEWRENIRRLEKSIELLRKDYGSYIEDRKHSEPYLWRIFIFDNIAYVSCYLHSRDNDKHAFVHKFVNSSNSMYGIFSKYFDYLWTKYDPKASDDLIEMWAEWK